MNAFTHVDRGGPSGQMCPSAKADEMARDSSTRTPSLIKAIRVDYIPRNRFLRTGPPRGFTLLEVILALAILAGALAVLGEVLRLAARQADETRSLTRAQLLAASKLAEITSGITYPAPAQGIPLESDPAWLYWIALEPTGAQGLVAVRVTVAQQQTPGGTPIQYALVRWIRDPNDVATNE